MNNTYTPNPTDISDVTLSGSILKLTELLAENSHENWAVTKIAQGYQYGPDRSDLDKTHPLLVPYSELTSSEKSYDLNTCMSTFRLLIKKGFVIKGPDE